MSVVQVRTAFTCSITYYYFTPNDNENPLCFRIMKSYTMILLALCAVALMVVQQASCEPEPQPGKNYGHENNHHGGYKQGHNNNHGGYEHGHNNHHGGYEHGHNNHHGGYEHGHNNHHGGYEHGHNNHHGGYGQGHNNHHGGGNHHGHGSGHY